MVVLTWRTALLARGALALLLVACAPCSAQDAVQASEYGIKAAYLFKFVGYVEWPPQALGNAPLAIGVLESDAMTEELARVANGRSSGGRTVAVRRLERGDPLTGLHVVFVGRSARDALARVLRAAQGRPLLTVTEADEGLAAGGMINFVVVEQKVRFDVALAPADAVSLKISSRLLAVARRVVPGPG